MTPHSHPSESHLLAYVTGDAEPQLRALLDCHLDLCGTCSAMVGQLSAPGGQWLAHLQPAEVPGDLFDRVMGRIQGQTPPAEVDLALPPAVRSLLPSHSRPDWKGILKQGFRFVQLMKEAPGGFGLYLVHLSAGTRFPLHRHGGLEEAVILAGGLADGEQRLEAGDWSTAEAGSAHAPCALKDEDCWLVARMEGGIHFSGWRGWLQTLSGSAS